MAYKDLLLSLTTYPDATPDAVADYAARLAKQFGAQVSAVAWELKLQRVGAFPFVADALLDLPGLMTAEMQKSAAHARRLAEVFEAAVKREGVTGRCEAVACPPAEIPDRLARRARLHDLTVVPILASDEVGPMYAEHAVFGSGRPVLIVPEASLGGAGSFDHVVVAWDHSRPAARALADAMPLLEAAADVHVVTVANEKPLPAPMDGEALVRHLSAHGVNAIPVAVDAAGRPIGAALGDYVRSVGADLLVMGAYGHSRVQQFILGGATRTILHAPPVPVLLSH